MKPWFGAAAHMPLTGIATFARAPYVPPDALQPGDAHFAVVGVPFDAAVGFRPGQRLAPRAIRDLSTRYALPGGRTTSATGTSRTATGTSRTTAGTSRAAAWWAPAMRTRSTRTLSTWTAAWRR